MEYTEFKKHDREFWLAGEIRRLEQEHYRLVIDVLGGPFVEELEAKIDRYRQALANIDEEREIERNQKNEDMGEDVSQYVDEVLAQIEKARERDERIDENFDAIKSALEDLPGAKKLDACYCTKEQA